MPVQTSYPGVYVQEVPSGVRTIAGVSTSIAVFIGQAVWGPANEPVLCLNYSDFDRTFTSETNQGDLARQVRLFFLNGGTKCYVTRVANAAIASSIELDDDTATADPALRIEAKYPGKLGELIRAVISHPTSPPALASEFDLTLYRIVLEKDGVTKRVDINGEDIRTDEQTFKGISLVATHPRFAANYVDYKWAKVSQVGSNINRPAITQVIVPLVPANLTGGVDGVDLVGSDYTAAYLVLDKDVDIFNLMILPKNKAGVVQKDLWGEASIFCQQKRAFLLMDPEGWTTAAEATDVANGVASLRTGLVKDHSGIFFPRLMIKEDTATVDIGPSGAIAGLMARIDSSRGVWKAPAGTEADLRGISGLQYRFTDAENGVLNPHAVNIIRIFPNGIVNWGARTMDGDDDFASEYKYIPIRRTALFIEESLYRGLKWVVFEPNDEPLWAQIRLNVGAFMHNLFRQGAFQGTKKQDAYFVKCDSETTTQNDINLGIVNIWVGFAPLKPAEFVILYLQQMTGQIQV